MSGCLALAGSRGHRGDDVVLVVGDRAVGVDRGLAGDQDQLPVSGAREVEQPRQLGLGDGVHVGDAPLLDPAGGSRLQIQDVVHQMRVEVVSDEHGGLVAVGAQLLQRQVDLAQDLLHALKGVPKLAELRDETHRL